MEKSQALFISEDGPAFGANQSDLNFTGVLLKWLHGKLLKMFRGNCCWQISYIYDVCSISVGDC